MRLNAPAAVSQLALKKQLMSVGSEARMVALCVAAIATRIFVK